MKGKLGVLGIAILAVYAFGPVAVAGAWGEDVYTFESSHLTLEGSQAEVSEFETAIGTVKCEEATFEATIEEKELSELTVTPAYSKCKAGELSVTVDMNGCKFAFGTPEDTEAEPPFDMHAAVSIVNCSSAIKITVPFCTVQIPEQTPSTPTVGLTNTNSEPFEATVTPTVEGFSYSYSGLCGSGSASDGVYRGAVKTVGAVVGGKPWFSVKRTGGTATEGANGHCEFTAAGQTCMIQFKKTVLKSLRVVSIRMLGPNGGTRYSKPKEECVFNLAFEECTDELKAEVFEAGGINDYCLSVEENGTKERRVRCAILHM